MGVLIETLLLSFVSFRLLFPSVSGWLGGSVEVSELGVAVVCGDSGLVFLVLLAPFYVLGRKR